jgi:hypothetical protein
MLLIAHEESHAVVVQLMPDERRELSAMSELELLDRPRVRSSLFSSSEVIGLALVHRGA